MVQKRRRCEHNGVASDTSSAFVRERIINRRGQLSRERKAEAAPFGAVHGAVGALDERLGFSDFCQLNFERVPLVHGILQSAVDNSQLVCGFLDFSARRFADDQRMLNVRRRARLLNRLLKGLLEPRVDRRQVGYGSVDQMLDFHILGEHAGKGFKRLLRLRRRHGFSALDSRSAIGGIVV